MWDTIAQNIDVILTDLAVLAPFATAVIVWAKRIIEGLRCQLRAEMLRIYYKNKDRNQIRQYEAEHFDKCYHAYKALKGNSFIDEIYKKAHQWEVIT
jgi:hypothetical protein